MDFVLDMNNKTITIPLANLRGLYGDQDWLRIMEQLNKSASQIVQPLADLDDRDPIGLVIFVTVIYCFIFILGYVGNVITCIVVSRNKSMHTATNFYLFNLAISDMLLLISAMPPDLYRYWYPNEFPFGGAFCVLHGLFAETATNATVLTISSFTIERYIAICHPFRQHAMSKLSRAVKFIIGIWLVAICLALPQAAQFGLVQPEGSSNVHCTIKNPSVNYAFEISSFLFFVGPMVLICVLYVLIGIKLKESRQLHANFQQKTNHNNNNTVVDKDYFNSSTKSSTPVRPGHIRSVASQTRIIRMLVAVVVTFFLCWAPFHAQRLLAVYGQTSNKTNEAFYEAYSILTYISGIMYFLSTCINPVLYNIMSYKFRSAFKTTIGSKCLKYKWRKKWSSRTTTTTQSSNRLPTVPDIIENIDPVHLPLRTIEEA